MEVPKITTHGARKLQQGFIGLPTRFRIVLEGELIFLRRATRDHRFQKNVLPRLRQKSEYGNERPRQHPRLSSWQAVHHFAPAIKPRGRFPVSMKKLVKTVGKDSRAGWRLYGLAQG